jgi:hypothetical protein
MSATFFGLTLEGKVMEYEDGQQASYADLVRELGCSDSEYIEELLRAALNLVSGQPADAFFARADKFWLQTVLRGAKKGRRADDSSKFYSNLAFDLGAALQKSDNPWRSHPSFGLLQFHVSGLNGRRVLGRDTARKADIVPTPRIAEACVFIRDRAAALGLQVDKHTVWLAEKLQSLCASEPVGRTVQDFNTCVSVSTGLDFGFEKVRQSDTGANAYNLGKARFENAGRLVVPACGVFREQTLPWKAIFQELATAVQGNDAAMWNVSEYLSKLICAMDDPDILENKIVCEVLARSALGMFPCAKWINEAVLATPLAQVYFVV